jgi:hypothetical protein
MTTLINQIIISYGIPVITLVLLLYVVVEISGLKKRFDKVDKRFDKVDEKFDKMNERIGDLSERVAGIEGFLYERPLQRKRKPIEMASA